MKRWPARLILAALLVSAASHAEAKPPRVLKFSGVPMSQASAIKKKFPYVFEREVTLAEVDEIVRWLMTTGSYSNIEVIERDGAQGRELVLVASVLRKIQEIGIQGNKVLSTNEVLRILNIAKGQTFERKDLLAAADELRKAYERVGYHNSRVEIDFDLPNDNEVRISARVSEGSPLKISDVIVDTPNSELAQRLKRMSRALADKVLTDDVTLDFQKSVNEYLQENRYLTARLSNPSVTYNADRTQARVTYNLDSPWRYEFFFNGNEYLSDGSILGQLELDKFSGAVSSPAPDLAEKIRRSYQAKGFANIEVDYSEKTLESVFKKQITFNLKEGPRVRIKKIEVTGNVSRPESYYAGFINSSSSDLIGKGFYNRKDIDEGAKRLVTELQNQGFLRAKVQSQRAEYSKDRASVTIHLQIDEGPLTQVRQIRFEGAEAFSRTELLDVLKIKAGSALSLKELEESIQALKEHYRSRGFLEMKIVNENEQDRIVSYNDTNTQANIDFQIYEGPKIVVSSIALQGNTFTKDHVILRELTFKEGDVLTPEKLDESIFHLQRLGLFSKVNIRTLDENTNISQRTVVVETSERDPGLFILGLGVNNDWGITYRGYLGIAYRNLGGTGRALSFREDVSYSSDPRISYLENRTTVSYLEPYIFGDHNRGRVNLIRNQYFPGYTGENQRTIIQEENTVNLLLERDLTRHVKLTFTAYSFSNQRQFDRQSYETIQTQNVAKVGPLVEFDYRDDPFNPTKGTFSFFNLEYADPAIGSSDDATQTIKFVKTNASFTTYNRLFENRSLVWANSVRGGYLSNLSDKPNSGVPVQETFFLGGRSTIRGFDPSKLERVPNNQQLGTSYEKFRVTADSYFYLLKTELRFPLIRTSSVGELAGAFFYDGGAVVISQPDAKIDAPYRHAAGFGLRIATPVGPVSLDYGWKLDRKPGEEPGAFYFSIGTF